MDGFTCDMCGKVLLADEDTRYIVRIEVYAAYDPMELSEEDMKTDHAAEMAKLLGAMERMDPRVLEDQVYKRLQFDLCPACQKKYLARPLPGEPPKP